MECQCFCWVCQRVCEDLQIKKRSFILLKQASKLFLDSVWFRSKRDPHGFAVSLSDLEKVYRVKLKSNFGFWLLAQQVLLPVVLLMIFFFFSKCILLRCVYRYCSVVLFKLGLKPDFSDCMLERNFWCKYKVYLRKQRPFPPPLCLSLADVNMRDLFWVFGPKRTQ